MKTVRKSIRLSPEEERLLRQACERYGMNDSEYFRYLLNRNAGGIPAKKTKEEYQAIKELVTEINRMGTNINQIVRNVNLHYYSDSEKRKLFAMMSVIMKKVVEL